jgi:hypothetical protein
VKSKICFTIYVNTSSGATTSPVTIERDFGAGCQEAPDKLPMTSVLCNVGIVKILKLKCDSLHAEYYCGSTEHGQLAGYGIGFPPPFFSVQSYGLYTI